METLWLYAIGFIAGFAIGYHYGREGEQRRQSIREGKLRLAEIVRRNNA